MNVLCFSDLHCDVAAAERIVEQSDQADVIIGAGDFANQHQGLERTLDVLKAISKPAILVPGNGETFEELQEAASCWNSARVLHGSGCEVMGETFWGVGGGIPVTPFGDWSYDFDEEQAVGLLKGCPVGGVLVVHSPPFDTVDHDRSGRIRGSQTIRATVEEKRPKLVVCGHIHDDWGETVQLGESRVINAGPSGQWVSLDSDG